jgi:hypothetical protein
MTAAQPASANTSVNREPQKLAKRSTRYMPIAETAVERIPQSLRTTTYEEPSLSTAPSSFSHSSERQIVGTSMSTTASSLTQAHDRQGIGSWISESSHGYPLSLQTMPIESSLACPYHGPMLQMTWTGVHPKEGYLPLARFQAEGPSEQNAAFHCPDTGELSISRDCSCYQIMEGILDLTTIEDDD